MIKTQRFENTAIPGYLRDRKDVEADSSRKSRRSASTELINERNQQRLNNSSEIIQDNYISKRRSSIHSSGKQGSNGPANNVTRHNFK